MKKRIVYKLRNLLVKLGLGIYIILVLMVVLTEVAREFSDNNKHLTRHAVYAGTTDLEQDISQRREVQNERLYNLEYQADTIKDSNRKARYTQLVNQARQVHQAADHLLNFTNALESKQSQASNLQGDFISTSRRRNFFRAEPETGPALSGRVQLYLKQFVELAGINSEEKVADKRYRSLKKLATMPAEEFHKLLYNKTFVYTQSAGVRVLQSQVVEMESNYLLLTEKAIKRADTFQ